MQEKITSLETDIQRQASEHLEKKEALHKQTRDLKGQLQESEAKISKLDSSLAEKSTRVEELSQKLQELESEFKTKVDPVLLLRKISFMIHTVFVLS